MGTIILHKGKRIDTGEEVTGYLVKMMGHHIIMPDDENTAYPVKEAVSYTHLDVYKRQIYYREVPSPV